MASILNRLLENNIERKFRKNREKARGGKKAKLNNRSVRYANNPVTDDPANQGLSLKEYWDYVRSIPIRKFSERVMESGQANRDELTREQLNRAYGFNSPRKNFLVPINFADIAMRKQGWLRGQKEDYGLLGNFVRKTYGSLPVYQQNPDADNVTRSRLVVFGNRNDETRSNMGLGQYDIGTTRSSLPNPGVSTSSFYIDPYTNKLYQKQWDVEKFSGGQHYNSQYNNKQKTQADYLDKLGHPIVLTTGFQPISEEFAKWDDGQITPNGDSVKDTDSNAEIIYGKHLTLDDLLAMGSDINGQYRYLSDHGIMGDNVDTYVDARDMMDEFMSKRKVDSNSNNNGLFVIDDVDGNGRNVYAMRELEVRPEPKKKRHPAEKRYGGRNNVFRDRF